LPTCCRCLSYLVPLSLLLLLALIAPVGHAAGPGGKNPPAAEVARALEDAARAHRVPSVLLKGLAYHESGWRQFGLDGAAWEAEGRVGLLGVPIRDRSDADRLRSDWRYNVEQGTKALVLAWNRAPILGNGRLDDGRNILECWFFALGRYHAGAQGAAANAYANRVLNAVAGGGAGRWRPVHVSRPSSERLASGWRNLFGPPAPWHFGDVPPRPPVIPVVSLNVPYVHQVYDVPEGHDGSGACGPSSMLMVLAFFGKVAPQPMAVSDPVRHESRFGALVPTVEAAVCEPNLGAVHAKMLAYLRPTFPHVAIFYDDKATWARVKAELDAGRPVLLGTRVTPAGHLMVARGYLSDGRLLVNDPAGDREQAARRPNLAWSPTGVRYWNFDGDKAVYEWDALQVRWVMTFGDRPAPAADAAEDEEAVAATESAAVTRPAAPRR